MISNQIGRVVAVHGYRVKVELEAGQRSPVRTTLEGTDTPIRINGYVTLEIGAGQAVLGLITDLDSYEGFEPDQDALTLELVRPRRMATLQLLGTVCIRERDGGRVAYTFDPGVNILPTLETPALPARREILDAVLADAPKRNIPSRGNPEEFDGALFIGKATAVERDVYGSFNDLFSRPFAVVGNTGSGKSCTIAHLLQAAVRSMSPDPDAGAAFGTRVRFFIIDINGEYSKAWNTPIPEEGHKPNRLYVNGKEFGVPLWLMNSHEACVWLNAAEQTQQPALVNLWAVAKGANMVQTVDEMLLRAALSRLQDILGIIDGSGWKKAHDCKQCWEAALAFQKDAIELETSETTALGSFFRGITSEKHYGSALGPHERTVVEAVRSLISKLEKRLGKSVFTIEQTADKPSHFPLAKLQNPAYLDAAAELSPGDKAMRQFLMGLRLRIQNRLSDKRWALFYSYGAEVPIRSAEEWFAGLGVGVNDFGPVCVIDCSMVAHEVLPYVCGIMGRMLLELREHVVADQRFLEPWVVVLEEAHNYVCPRRQDEPRGVAVSRETFERIAKEGRKFGLSLIVASQRPSEISSTVLSQCANFVLHRLQNPDDIDHFRKIVPSQSKRLIDQITILRAGEAIVAGSAFHVPTRVQVQRPSPEPASESSTPFAAWSGGATSVFPLANALSQWGVSESQATEPQSQQTTSPPQSDEDECPF